MADRNARRFRRARVKEELITDEATVNPPQMKHPQGNSQKSMRVPKVEETELEGDIDDVPYLSGKPFFDVTLSKTHVTPHFNLVLPVRIASNLPRENVPAVLWCNHKQWEATYHGEYTIPRLDSGWKTFVNENHLEQGDACVFEVMKSSPKVVLKVHILKNELPPELVAIVKSVGTPENPINID